MLTRLMRLLVPALMVVLMASPANAAGDSGGGTQIPEASSVLLFALGLAGVLIGRSVSMRGRKDDDQER